MNLSSDMDDKSEMKRDAIDKVKDVLIQAQEYLGHTDIHEDEVSKKMKEYFDKKYQPNWNCIVGIFTSFYMLGKNFYSSFSHESKTFIFFYIGQIAVLLYKLG